ncbi:ferredoxin--NADP+ reductase [Breznakibacter xylanolyticus]|uniref:Ferredoxin--NADP+ reductase n=1 Tax=Breznakibacter xylanolyticus TaxID=990 RepID=A0A2W7N3L9_9BACT|nr:FAD-binding oxidoreductase [Breznakibacter xylanolyticus]PZX12947.1 ferredoxin--NADP+ reductase [Breznakibacter xylanolyticus]
MTSSVGTPYALFPHRVLAIEAVAPQVYVLDLEKRFHFLPGQVVAVALPDDAHKPRLYSVAGSPRETRLRILFDVKADGWLTPRLARLKPGDHVQVSEPFGKFIGDDAPAWWIATGTGVAPFVSMTEAGLAHNKTLIHGARTLNKFYFASLFEQHLGDRYHRFCTTAQAPHVAHGRLTHWLESHPHLPLEIKYYLCGHADMVVEVRRILVEQKGIPYHNVLAEIYF